MLRLLLLAAFVAFVPPSAALAQLDPNAPVYQDGSRLRRMGWAVHDYADKNGGQLPPDLASLATVIAPAGEDFADTVRKRFLSPGRPGPEVPEGVTPAWINEHSSYKYLGRGDLALTDLPWWNDLAIAHLKLDQPHRDAEGNELFTVVMLDGSVSIITSRRDAEALIDRSRQVIDAVATGGPLPEYFEVLSDLRLIHEAADAYAKANGDALPGDLGALLAYVPETRRTKTARQKAGVFLPPRVERNVHIPEEPTAEWVNRQAGYVYLGAAGAKLSQMDFFEGPILAMTRPEDAVPSPGGGETLTAIARVRGVERATAECIAWAVPYTEQVMDASRGKGAWPDLAHALRDLKFIGKALEAYVQARQGEYPPDLGALVEFLPAEAGATAAERARVFVSPRVERVTAPPADLSEADAPEWVRKHASYVSLIPAGLKHAQVRRQDGPVHVYVHTAAGEEYTVVRNTMHEPDAVSPALNWGWAWAFSPGHLGGEIERTKDDIAKLRAGLREKE